MSESILATINRPLVPLPRRIEARPGRCALRLPLTAQGASAEDRFAVEHLTQQLREAFADCPTGSEGLTLRFSRDAQLPAEGYRLTVGTDAVDVVSADPAGAYYATQTLLQLFAREGREVLAPCCFVEDSPALRYRAIHYDTKHHQPTAEYVEWFIRTLAHYKVNLLVWEWEDKFAYPSHPEIGAPGAFTLEQMQHFTRLARQHHVQIVPLVQGLGHVSYILKHPQHAPLREIPGSNWEFCPLKEGTYKLLFDLWGDAMDATPGSEFLHLGSDETYELGLGEACGCRAHAERHGKDSLMHLFLTRSAEFIASRSRKVLSWGGAWKKAPDRPGHPRPIPGVIYTVGHDPDSLRSAQQAGFDTWVYAPNPGIEPLFLPHFPTVIHSMWQTQYTRTHPGLFHQTAHTIALAAREVLTDITSPSSGSITTSWDDSGLHDVCWIHRFITAAEFSWNPAERNLDHWTDALFANYFGPQARDLRELFILLQEGALFYYDTFERRVWHWGDVGKMHLPDFPRGDLEISNFWRSRYAHLLPLASKQRLAMARAMAIINANLARGTRRDYDLQIYRSVARLMDHNAGLILMLGDLEHQICLASEAHYKDRARAYGHLVNAIELIDVHLRQRQAVFADLVELWEKTRLPKGLSLPEKPYVFARDRARHFANRTPDMEYLVMDETKLDLEGYVERLRMYAADYARENGL